MRDDEVLKRDCLISDSEINYDSPIDDEDEEEPADFDEGDEEEKVNKVFNEQDKLNKKIMQQTPFGQSVNSNWGNPVNNQPSWGNTQGSSWGNTSSQQFPWQRSPTPSWGNSNSGSSWGTASTPQNNSWGGVNNGKKEINRQKRVIFCDVLDCLIETFQSNGKPGLLPRGIYDVRLRFEVWDKLACFNPEKIYAMIPGSLLSSSNGSDSWRVLLDYVICALSEYLRVPYTNCQIIIQGQLGQTKDIIIGSVLKNLNYNLADIIQIGLDSGLYGQSNKDLLAAENLGIDYLDLGQLLNLYF